MKTYFIKTYGCQMNEADSLWLEKILQELGYGRALSLEEADILVINSCSVRQATEDKVYGLAPRIQELKIENCKLKIVLTGCMVGSAAGERRRIKLFDLKKRMPWVDYFISPDEIFERLPEILSDGGVVDAETGHAPSLQTRPKAVVFAARVGEEAYVPVMRGCDRFCSYCVVPYGRGRERSRPMGEITTEVKELVGRGVKKITLLGQNVNSYGKDLADLDHWYNTLVYYHNGEGMGESRRSPFACLLRHLHKIEGLEKIWFLTSNPWDFFDDSIGVLALPKIEKYLHLPVQSGDDEILKKMNRPYTAAEYKKLVEKIRKEVPGIRLGTDLIVGFPGETKEQFQHTVDLVREVGFSGAYIAMYSERPGTAAAKLYKDDVPREEKKRRHAVLTKVVSEKPQGLKDLAGLPSFAESLVR